MGDAVNEDFALLATPLGFAAVGAAVGIKASGREDMSLFVVDARATAAAIFTRNRVQAAPIVVSREHLALSGGTARAVLVSSGNANAATGIQGISVARQLCAEVAGALGCAVEEVLLAQTGLIGLPLDEQIALAGARRLVAMRDRCDWETAARGMMTTDTRPKCASSLVGLPNGKTATVAGFGKGVAMAAPAMATMLAVILTDAPLSVSAAQSLLRDGADHSFHLLNIDGCQSTNDTVYLLASGLIGGDYIADASDERYAPLAEGIRAVCRSLARQMASDAEGRSKFLHVIVNGALTDADARKIARQVVGSSLVKCAMAGGVPYWGRVLAEVGAAGVPVDPDVVSISFGELRVCDKGTGCDHDRAAVQRYMLGETITICVDLGLGGGTGEAFGSDLTREYVSINMEKS